MNNGGGIRYNWQEAQNATELLKTQILSIGKFLLERFEPFSATFRQNWVGPDEITFENTYLGYLHAIYLDCIGLGADTSKFIMDSCDVLEQFQNSVSNSLVEMNSKFMSNVTTMGSYEAEQANIKLDSKYDLNESNGEGILMRNRAATPEYNQDTNFGLQSDSAASALVEELDSFTTDINTRIESLKENNDIGNAFVYETEGMGVKALLESLMEQMKKLTEFVKDFKDVTIQSLEKKYREEADEIVRSSEKLVGEWNNASSGEGSSN